MTKLQNFTLLIFLISTIFTVLLVHSCNWERVEVAKVEAHQ